MRKNSMKSPLILFFTRDGDFAMAPRPERGTRRSPTCAMARKPKSNDVYSMKKLRLLSLVGITSFALAHAGLAAGHGGGGGFHGGGGGFRGRGGGFHGGGHFHGGFAGGGFHGGGFRGGQFSSMRGGHMLGRSGIHGRGLPGD